MGGIRLLIGSCLFAAALAAFPVGCGGGNSGGVASGHNGTGGGAGDASAGSGGDSGINLGKNKIQSITVKPASASIEIVDGKVVTQAFTAYANYADGSTQQISSPTWSAAPPAPGTIDNSGVFTPTGDAGGQVTVTAGSQGKTGTAKLDVKLRFLDDSGSIPPAVQSSLTGATTQDTSCVWAYPYDKTVFPRGLLSPPLEWNGGGASDSYYVRLSSPYFVLEAFTSAPPPSRYTIDPALWRKFTDSTSGAAQLFVSRYDGQNATVVTQQTWTIAPESMRGTIYYWANNLGRVMRIKPGASAPDDFANHAPLNDPNSYTQSSCLMTCHTVSADGSMLISGGGTFGGSYDLQTSQPVHYTGGTWGSTTEGTSVVWSNSAVSPDGKYMLTNTMAVGLSMAAQVPGPSGFEALYDTQTGAKVPNSGLDGAMTAMPAWSPEGSLIAYVAAGDPAGWYQTWNVPPPGDLHVIDFNATNNPMASNDHVLISAGSDPNNRIVWPTVSPDGKWVIYGRSAGADTRTGNGDLYIASTQTPNSEMRVAELDGDGYPFAAGSRDLHWNFEPTFAPVASGGYFWVVFTSRRTYGNELLGTKDQVKQLWVAAIDQKPTAGQDPSHPPFRLQGQDASSLNMRGFWALEPCRQDGQSCSSGTQCCNGYCSQDPEGGGPVCSQKHGCSQTGDHCDTDADCCAASSGVTCINHVCSQPPPQ